MSENKKDKELEKELDKEIEEEILEINAKDEVNVDDKVV